MRDALDRRLAFLHRLQERRLGLRRRAVDLVGEEEVGEDRPGAELEVAVALVPDRRARDVGRHEIRRELNAREPHAQYPREGARRERLRETGVVLEQDVPVGEEAEQHELERLALADDRLLDLVEHPTGELPDLCQLHDYKALQRVDDAVELLRRDSAGEPVLGRGSVGAHELPGLLTDERPWLPRAVRRARSACARQAGLPRWSERAGPAGSAGRTTLRRRGRPRARSDRDSGAAVGAATSLSDRLVAAASRSDTRAEVPPTPARGPRRRRRARRSARRGRVARGRTRRPRREPRSAGRGV